MTNDCMVNSIGYVEATCSGKHPISIIEHSPLFDVVQNSLVFTLFWAWANLGVCVYYDCYYCYFYLPVLFLFGRWQNPWFRQRGKTTSFCWPPDFLDQIMDRV